MLMPLFRPGLSLFRIRSHAASSLPIKSSSPVRSLPCTDALDSCLRRNDREPAPAWFQQGAPQSESHSFRRVSPESKEKVASKAPRLSLRLTTFEQVWLLLRHHGATRQAYLVQIASAFLVAKATYATEFQREAVFAADGLGLKRSQREHIGTQYNLGVMYEQGRNILRSIVFTQPLTIRFSVICVCFMSSSPFQRGLRKTLRRKGPILEANVKSALSILLQSTH